MSEQSLANAGVDSDLPPGEGTRLLPKESPSQAYSIARNHLRQPTGCPSGTCRDL